MKKMNKKGFTITELVIVIAVIAILAAVLIPTFATIINKAEASKALTTAKNAYTAVITADDDASISVEGKVDAYIVVGDYYFSVNEGQLTELGKTSPENVTLSDAATNAEDYELLTGVADLENSSAKVYLYTAATTTEG